MMKRATITMTDELEQAVIAYQQQQEVPPTLTAVAQAALREYIAERGYLSPQPCANRIGSSPRRWLGHRNYVSDTP